MLFLSPKKGSWLHEVTRHESTVLILIQKTKFSFMENKVLQCIMHYGLLFHEDDDDFSSSTQNKTLTCDDNIFNMLNMIFPQRSKSQMSKLKQTLFAQGSC